MSTNPFPEHLRAQYDAQLLDDAGRRVKAKQLQSALQDAGVWNAPRTILDVGCGTGLTLASLEAPHARRIGCDVRREPFEKGGGQRTIEFVQADCAKLPFVSQKFDLVLCLAVIGEFPDWRAAITEMARCVAPEGYLYITIANSPMLLRRYAIQEMFGARILASWWSYARACLPLYEVSAAQGLGLADLKRWRYVNVTPHLARASFGGGRYVPRAWMAATVPLLASSFAHAWQRPRE